MATNLDNIIKGRDKRAPRVVFYAVSGFGKTTFASQTPNPIFIQCEEGVGNLEYARFPLAKTYSDVVEALETLATEDHKYQTVVIDTIDLLERLIFDEVVKDHNESSSKQVSSIGDIGFGAGYTKALSYWTSIMRALDYLRDQKDMMTVLLAHSQIKTFTPPDAESYDRYRFNMHDKASEVIKDWADIVLFGNYKVHTKTTGEGFNKTTRGIGGDRYIYTQERPAHWGGNRYSLPYELPFPEGQQWAVLKDAIWPPKNKKVETETQADTMI